jgi:transporter family-2 protein
MAFVQVTAELLSLAALLFYRTGSFAALGGVTRIFWLGGVLGLIITITVMLGIKSLSPTVAIFDDPDLPASCRGSDRRFRLMDTEKIAFCWTKFLGLALMIAGVLIF